MRRFTLGGSAAAAVVGVGVGTVALERGGAGASLPNLNCGESGMAGGGREGFDDAVERGAGASLPNLKSGKSGLAIVVPEFSADFAVPAWSELPLVDGDPLGIDGAGRGTT